MMYHLFFYLIWQVVKKHKTFFWESGVRYNLSGSVALTVVCISVEKCIQFFSMAWQTFRALQHPWQSGSLKILIRGFQKGKTRPCTSRYIKVTRCQIWKKKLQNLTSCNFGAPWGTRLCFTFLETSNQYL